MTAAIIGTFILILLSSGRTRDVLVVVLIILTSVQAQRRRDESDE